MSHITIREPFASYFKALDDFRVHAEPYSGAYKICMGGVFSTISLPPLDRDDAEQLEKELREAVMPIIQRFKAKKLNEFMNTVPQRSLP